MKPELLAPAGNLQIAKVAINAGADAIYFGGEKYSARASADNFTLHQIAELCEYAHPLNVKVYLAINTLLFESEFKDALSYIKSVLRCGVDALIVQDLGLISYLQNAIPSVVIHASTQLHIHNVNGLNIMLRNNVKRCVVARETTLKTLNKMREVPIELEYFVHGALCISYSGQCYMSLMSSNRSGNRGDCAQLCRYRYQLTKDDKVVPLENNYLISPKDLNLLEHLKQIDVDSIKIEGRLKRESYVAEAVLQYRAALDGSIDEKSSEKLTKQFSRGFTAGYLNSQLGSNIINAYRPNHMGMVIGEVIGQTSNKIKVKLTHPLHQFDAVRFIYGETDQGFIINYLYKGNNLVSIVDANEEALLEVEGEIPIGTKLYLTTDSQRNKELETFQKNIRRIACDVNVTAEAGQPLKLEFKSGNKTVMQIGALPLIPARNRPTSKIDIEEKISQMGDTRFQLRKLDIKLSDNVFVNMSQLKMMRREGLTTLELHLKEKPNIEIAELEVKNDLKTCDPRVFIEVKTEEQYMVVKKYNFEIITSNGFLSRKFNIGQITPTVNENDYYISTNTVVASQIGDLQHQKKYSLSNYHIPVTNVYSYLFVKKHGVEVVEFSPEIDDVEIGNICRILKQNDGALMVYGRYVLMTMKNCLVNTHILDNNKKDCSLCHQSRFSLRSNQGIYPVLGDDLCNCEIYDQTPINKIQQFSRYRDLGLRHFVIRFYDETANDVKIVMEQVKEQYES